MHDPAGRASLALTLKDPETERTAKPCRALVPLFLCHMNTGPLCSSVTGAQGPHPARFFDLAALMYVYTFVYVYAPMYASMRGVPERANTEIQSCSKSDAILLLVY